jgi:large subunit ribosomal protein L18
MKNLQKVKQQKRARRHQRVRAKIKGTAKRPRLSVFRSNKHIYTQLIDDEKGHTLVSASDLELDRGKQRRAQRKSVKSVSKSAESISKSLKSKIETAKEVGRLIAKKALEKKIKQVVFDRGGYKYHGRVKALAEGAREEGLKF